MKSKLWVALLLGGLAFEGQTGSRSNPFLPPQFGQVRVISGGTPSAASASASARALTVMTWNIDHGVALPAISSAMSSHPASLWLLQEVDWDTARSGEKDVAAELGRDLHLSGAYAIEFEELSQERGHPAYIGQATLSELPIERSRIIRFETQSGFWRPHAWLPSGVPLMQRRVGSRIALVTELPFAGLTLVVYNAHLESRSAGAIQLRQLDEIIDDTRRYGPETALILGGDLNTKYLPSMFLRKLEGAGFRSVLDRQIRRTHTIAMALDWIFVKGRLRVGAGAVRRDVHGSDHYPVYAELEALAP